MAKNKPLARLIKSHKESEAAEVVVYFPEKNQVKFYPSVEEITKTIEEYASNEEFENVKSTKYTEFIYDCFS